MLENYSFVACGRRDGKEKYAILACLDKGSYPAEFYPKVRCFLTNKMYFWLNLVLVAVARIIELVVKRHTLEKNYGMHLT